MTPVTWTPDDPGTLFAGIDLGSTAIKLAVLDADGAEVLAEQRPTPWTTGPGGTTDLSPDALLAVVRDLLGAADATLRTADAVKTQGAGRVRAVGIAGMGETGMLVDAEGRVVAPGFAWYDPRGAAEAEAFPDEVKEQFPGRTGLPLGAQVTVAKLAHLRAQGRELAGLRWLNLPEYLATALGGTAVREHSLASRTGLVDQDTGEPWQAMLELLGVDESFLPPAVHAGAPVGAVSAQWPAAFAGAALTVAGHDHLVGAEADGGLPADHYHVSMGTAEVLLRVIDAPLGYAARSRLAAALINEVHHVVPGKRVLVAGVKSGLLMRRVLQLAGIGDRAQRDVLDAAVSALPYEGDLAPGTVEVHGARNDDGVLRLALHGDGASPAELFGAVLRHGNDEIARLIAVMDRELPAAATSTVTGGWSRMTSVQRARARVLPRMSVAPREQETVYGAALTARRLCTPNRQEIR